MQRQPEDLYELDEAVLDDALPDLGGAALLVHLEGFMDAGSAGRLLTEHLLEGLENQPLARFDTDRLLDYRSRRPLMTFDKTRWETYEDPTLEVRLLRDGDAKPLLLLTGPEPDHEWELFVAATRSLAERLNAGPMITYFGVPMGIPHTRPLGVMTHATRPGLVTSRVPSPGKLQVPASAAALMEFRFGQAGRDAVGLVVQVPHYLAQAAYPTAALTLLDSVREITGVAVPGDALQAAAERTNTLIDQQVAESSEVAELVHGLEVQWDAASPTEGNLLAEGEEMPTADELAAQFEQFLADQQRGGDTPEF
ncbi:MAG TPA: PAC2 family protein [Trebonia sp.]|jgi:proteasome assembly chaperone (PAC2) family protein|nr:PAC2 family protein [Trebonia sp.]